MIFIWRFYHKKPETNIPILVGVIAVPTFFAA